MIFELEFLFLLQYLFAYFTPIPSSPCLPVHVILNGKWEGEVDDVVHVGDIQPPRSHVRGHQ